MTVYTGRGDEGQTDLGNAERVSKTDHRIEAYGTVDEANALVGRVRPTGYDDVDDQLKQVQNCLHVVQAEFANPDTGEDDPQIGPEDIDQLEDWIDEADEELEPLTSFILPGGGDAGARLHQARAVTRRAERRAVALAEQDDEAVNAEAIRYLNRLSDYLFTAARLVNQRDGVPEESPTY
ncbi:cob(I)yrinic acid a,c-diamide adenosyltransferase [Halolamina sediminis]|uniref:cob(I)yrinic acid a,c-diamide adenosyltransferase n=1 Tax=Halolamina sediminis TaxID=1480675 RepID=UPI0006B5CDBB|nr:cob(I)yrinic acid a,c-diamide adenosyltransferase [Halolamina sediminis]